jgi:hypothetical protein
VPRTRSRAPNPSDHVRRPARIPPADGTAPRRYATQDDAAGLSLAPGRARFAMIGRGVCVLLESFADIAAVLLQDEDDDGGDGTSSSMSEEEEEFLCKVTLIQTCPKREKGDIACNIGLRGLNRSWGMAR